MRLKFLCPDAAEEDNARMNGGDVYLADARRFKDEIKKQFLGYRADFRKVMNEVRSTHYADFAQLGLEKGKDKKPDAYK